MPEYDRADINQAAFDGDLELVNSILALQPDLADAEHPVHTDRYPIQYASRQGHVEVVQRLLDAGANPSGGGYRINESANALAAARDRGHQQIVALIMAWLEDNRGVQPESSLFCEAIGRGDVETVRRMLERSPDLLNSQTEADSTPLHTAVDCGHIELVSELLKAGADVDAVAGRGRAVHVALLWGGDRHNLIAGILLGHGARYDIWIASALGDLNGVRGFLDADPSQANAAIGPAYYQQLPLTIAVKNRQRQVVERLLEAGADPDATLEWDAEFTNVGSPLWHAAENDDVETARLLLARGATVNTNLYAMYTATASYKMSGGRKSEAMLRLLYSHGGLNGEGVEGYAKEGNLAVVTELLRREPHKAGRALAGACAHAQVDVVQLVLNQFRPDMEAKEWFRLLYDTMCEASDEESRRQIMQSVFAAGVSPKVTGRERHSLLHRLATLRRISEGNRLALGELLLDAGADPDARDNELESTALGWACRYNRPALVELLLRRGAGPNQADDEPWATPLAWAKRHDCPECEAILLNHGATA